MRRSSPWLLVTLALAGLSAALIHGPRVLRRAKIRRIAERLHGVDRTARVLARCELIDIDDPWARSLARADMLLYDARPPGTGLAVVSGSPAACDGGPTLTIESVVVGPPVRGRVRVLGWLPSFPEGRALVVYRSCLDGIELALVAPLDDAPDTVELVREGLFDGG